MAICNIIWSKTEDKMKTQYRIAEYKDYFAVEEWDEKLRVWEQVLVSCGSVNQMECTTCPVLFNSLEDAKIYIKKLQEKSYPIYHSV